MKQWFSIEDTMESGIKKFLNPFCFACTFGLLPYLSTKCTAKWQNIAGPKKFFNLVLIVNWVLSQTFFEIERTKKIT